MREVLWFTLGALTALGFAVDKADVIAWLS